MLCGLFILLEGDVLPYLNMEIFLFFKLNVGLDIVSQIDISVAPAFDQENSGPGIRGPRLSKKVPCFVIDYANWYILLFLYFQFLGLLVVLNSHGMQHHHRG